MVSRFFEPLGEMKIGLISRLVREIGGKITVVTKTWNHPKPAKTNQYDSMRPEKTLCLWCCVMLRDYIVLDIA